MGGGAWWAAVHGVAKSRTRLRDFTFTFHFHALEKEMATHSSVLAWRIPGTAEPGGLPSMGSHRVGHDWSNLAAAAVEHKKRKKESKAFRQNSEGFLKKIISITKNTFKSTTKASFFSKTLGFLWVLVKLVIKLTHNLEDVYEFSEIFYTCSHAELHYFDDKKKSFHNNISTRLKYLFSMILIQLGITLSELEL